MPTKVIPIVARASGKAAAAPFRDGVLVDTRGRPLRDLRISVTDRCNFRCVYCMPKEVFDAGLRVPAAQRAPDLRGDRAARAHLRRPRRARRSASPAASRCVRKQLERLVAMLAGLGRRTHAHHQRLAARAARRARCRDAGLKRVTVSLDSLDDATFRRMNDVDFPVAQGARRHRRRGGRRARAGQDQHGGEARRERRRHRRRWRGASAAPATSCASSSTWTSARTNGWRMDDVVPSARDRRSDRRELPLEPVDPNYTGEVAERWRYRDGARRDRRDRVGDAGVLPRLHARAPVDRGQALHLPLRAARATTCEALLRGGASDDDDPQTRSRRSGSSAPTATRRSAPRRPRRCGRSRCPTSAAEEPQARVTNARDARDVRGRGAQRARRGAADADRRRASAHALRRQARDRDADDARAGARGARHRLPAQPAAGRARSRRSPRCRSTGRPTRSRSRRATGIADLDDEDEEAHRDHRLRPGHRVRRPDGGDRRDPAARRRHARPRQTLYALLERCARTRRSTSRPARCTAARSPARRARS